LPFEDNIQRQNLSFYFYADDTRLYLSFKPSEGQAIIAELDHCLFDVRDWMAANFLKLNDDKTELAIIGHVKRLANIRNFDLSVGITKEKPSPCVINLGLCFDSSLSFKPFIQKTAATADFQIRSLFSIKDHLPRK